MSAIQEYLDNEQRQIAAQRARISTIVETAHPVMLQLVEAILAEERDLLNPCDGQIKLNARFFVILNEVQDIRITIGRRTKNAMAGLE